ncbi:putative Transcription factor domain-containing protein [Seiridium unicorne]|uniref:Transcription factor domain-containing protein n=1 Tax=Seiridium unicorne TaxID=138068 RepID=A0ABR2UWT6_9PEZI
MSSFDPASLKILERLDELQSHLQQSIESSIRPIYPTSHTVVNAATTHQRHLFPGNLDAILEWPVIKQYRVGIPSQESLMSSTPSISMDLLPTGTMLSADLDPATCDRLLDNFFHYVHIKNPVLDERQTRRMVKRVFSEGISWDQ